jgi:hypothetical protein
VKVKVLSSFSVFWLPNAPAVDSILEVDDHREALCRDLRVFAEKGLVEILEPQVRPDYAKARAEVKP